MHNFQILVASLDHLKHKLPPIPGYQRQIEALANALASEDAMKKHICNDFASLGILFYEVALLNEHCAKVILEKEFKKM